MLANRSSIPQTYEIRAEGEAGEQALVIPALLHVDAGASSNFEVSILPHEFVALDLETSGLSPQTNSIIEVGVARYLDTEVVDTYSSLVWLDEELDPFVTFLTGITQAMLQNAPGLNSVLLDVIARLRGLPVVTYSVNQFDQRFLESAAKSAGVELPILEWVNAYTWAQEAFPTLPSHRLDAVASSLGAGTQEHRALADATLTGQAFLECLKQLGSTVTVSVWTAGHPLPVASVSLPIDH
ncbi:unnamed protein product [marine sediment metagenome]|uniref:Exonuclease domain-containing protein n=1 Tax=marine sediment metagenome TaxID=412755 RepID=X0RUH7_9ZZZZ